jgi:RimJ/RimL family protein N-acetyltransferase
LIALDPLPRIAGDVVLRRLAPADLAAFQAYRQDPDVARYQGWTIRTDDEAAAFLSEMASAPLLRAGEWSQIGIADRDTMALVGDIGLLLASDGREAEIGFTLRPQSQRRGWGTDAVREAIDLVFEHTAAERVLGITDVRNRPSIRLLCRVGMSFVESRTATFRGEPCEEHVYAIARPAT